MSLSCSLSQTGSGTETLAPDLILSRVCDRRARSEQEASFLRSALVIRQPHVLFGRVVVSATCLVRLDPGAPVPARDGRRRVREADGPLGRRERSGRETGAGVRARRAGPAEGRDWRRSVPEEGRHVPTEGRDGRRSVPAPDGAVSRHRRPGWDRCHLSAAPTTATRTASSTTFFCCLGTCSDRIIPTVAPAAAAPATVRVRSSASRVRSSRLSPSLLPGPDVDTRTISSSVRSRERSARRGAGQSARDRGQAEQARRRVRRASSCRGCCFAFSCGDGGDGEHWHEPPSAGLRSGCDCRRRRVR